MAATETGNYSYAQLEALWINAGGSKALAPLMAAIAEAESGGDPTAYNPSGATGLWQILGAVNPADQASLTSPAVNAKEAVLKYESQGLDAWTTYTSGAYAPFLSDSTPPDYSGVPAGSTAGTAAGTTTASTSTGTCVVSMPSIGPIGGGCLFTKSNARAMIGGLCITAGVLIALPGVVILALAGFERTGGAQQIAAAAGRVPGYGKAFSLADSAAAGLGG